MTETNPVTKVAKERRSLEETDHIILADGSRGRILPVSAHLISDVTRAVKDPEVPTVHDEDHGKEIPNPDNPQYLRGLEEARAKRGLAAMDAMLMFGLELLDGVPADRKWLKKLQSLERQHLVDLSTFDLEDEIDMEFLYKRYIASDSRVLEEITKRTGLTEEVIREAEDSFPGN